MGYRHYMYIVPKNKIDKIKDLSYRKLIQYCKENGFCRDNDDTAFDCLNYIVGGKTFFEFGKCYENSEEIYKTGIPLFSKKETQNRFSEYNPYVVGQDAVLCAIEYFRKIVYKWFDELLMSQDEHDATREWYELGLTSQEDRIKNYLEQKRDEWSERFLAVNLDMKKNQIVNSWLYEYEIFELVHQMKMMDWENNVLVFYGW